MIYYIVFHLCAVGMGLLFNFYRRNAFLFVLLFLSIIFSGFRYDAGNDFFSYLDMLIGVKDYDQLEFLAVKLIDLSYLVGTPTFFYLITSLIYISVLGYALCRAHALSFTSVFLLLFFTASWLTSFGYIRQFVSISFFFLSFVFLCERKYFFYLVFAVVSFLFHKSALVTIPALLFYVIFARQERSVICYLAVLIVSLVAKDLLVYLIRYFGIFTQYIEFSINSYGTGIFKVLLFVWVVNVGVAKVLKVKRDGFWIYSNMLFCGVLLYGALLSFGEYVVRVAYFFVPFFYVSSVYLMDELGARWKFLMLAFYMVVGSFTYYYTLYLAGANPTRDFLTNYKFVLFL